MRFGFRQAVISAVVFGAVLLALTSIDPRVHDQLTDLFTGGTTPVGDRLGDLGTALWAAVRYQSIDNAPLLVFATVGTVLTLFMLKS